MTCENGPDLKKLAQKKNQIGESGGERKKSEREPCQHLTLQNASSNLHI